MIPRAVFDANVLASGILGLSREDAGAPSLLLRLWMLGRFTLIVSQPLLDELEYSAFGSEYFRRILSREAMQQSLSVLRQSAVVGEVTLSIQGIASDPDDDHVLDVALHSDAHYIVTGDKGLLSLRSFQDVQIVDPRAFLDLL